MAAIEDLKLAQTVEEVTQETRKTLEELFNKWHAMYEVTKEMTEHRSLQFVHHVKDFYEDMLSSEESKKIELTKEVEAKLDEHNRLQKELGVNIDIASVNSEPLTKIIEGLDSAMKHYRQIRAARITKFKSLKNQEKDLCDILGMTLTTNISILSKVPSEEELEQVEHHVFTLQEEKIKRMATYKEAKAKALEIIEALEKKPVSTFETQFLSDENEAPKLSNEIMIQIEKYVSSLEEELKIETANVNYFLGKLRKLWDKIKEDEWHCTTFIERHQGVGASVVKALKEEISRCEEIKLANIKPVIENVKHELDRVWDKLTYTEEQRKQFKWYFCQIYNEEALELLEMELERLQQLYDDNLELFELANKRRELWERMLHLDEAAQDKNRLFNNRGGQLLKEEKERKMLETTLPKIDKQLQQLLIAYQENGTPFLWYGEDLLHKIVSDWEGRTLAKESKKQARKAEHAKALEIEAKLGARPAQKRKLPTTPKSANVSSKLLKPATSSDQLFCNSMNSAGNRTITLSSKGRMGSGKRLVDVGLQPCYTMTRSRPGTPIAPVVYADISSTSIASYSHFQEQLEERSREPCTPGRQALKEINSPVVIHSSPNTPPGSSSDDSLEVVVLSDSDSL